MIRNAADLGRRTIDSSAVAQVLRTVIAGSAVCGAAAAAVQRLRRTRERIVVGLGGRWTAQQALVTSRQLDAIASDSLLIGKLSALLSAPSAARSEARVGMVAGPVLALDLRERISTCGCALAVAVVTHTVLMAALGVAVQPEGWAIRGVLAVAGVGIMTQAGPLAAAWRDRQARRAARRHR